MSEEQYRLVGGQWVDAWNGGTIDTSGPLPVCAQDGETWSSVIGANLLKWCGCFIADEMLQRVDDYLSGRWGRYGDEGEIIHFDLGDSTQTLIALACDGVFTEHGGGIGGSWLTDEGRAWLDLRRAEALNDERPRPRM